MKIKILGSGASGAVLPQWEWQLRELGLQHFRGSIPLAQRARHPPIQARHPVVDA